MSDNMAYEERDFIHDDHQYPAGIPGTQADPDPTSFANPHDAVGELAPVATYNAPSAAEFAASAEAALQLASPPADLVEAQSPSSAAAAAAAAAAQRVKAIPKPDRPITKNNEGKFVCTYQGCTEEVKAYSRKCEWSKHMDRHDRPYKCLCDGCEKLPGFTYSGGLLRHEREVHNKHGGPKNSFMCPHSNCKRAAGKGFSRQENLNEHLRRVHTQGGTSPVNGADVDMDEDTGSDRVTAGVKRKLSDLGDDDNIDLRETVKRLREQVKRSNQKQEELHRQNEGQTMQIAAMMQTIASLQANLHQMAEMQLQHAQPPTSLIPQRTIVSGPPAGNDPRITYFFGSALWHDAYHIASSRAALEGQQASASPHVPESSYSTPGPSPQKPEAQGHMGSSYTQQNHPCVDPRGNHVYHQQLNVEPIGPRQCSQGMMQSAPQLLAGGQATNPAFALTRSKRPPPLQLVPEHGRRSSSRSSPLPAPDKGGLKQPRSFVLVAPNQGDTDTSKQLISPLSMKNTKIDSPTDFLVDARKMSTSSQESG